MTRESEDPIEPVRPWSPCPAGELARLGRKQRGRKQRRLFLRRMAAGSVVAATGGGLAWWLHPFAEPTFGGLTCSEIHQLAEGYAKNKLDESLHERVRQHLVLCPRCGPWAKAKGLKT